MQIFSGEVNPLSQDINLQLKEGNLVIINDVEHDIRSEAWKDEAIRRHFLSMAAIPIKVKGEFKGRITLYSERSNFFNTERALFEEIGNDVSYALEAIELEEKTPEVRE
jgi:GAF domain-containing protein